MSCCPCHACTNNVVLEENQLKVGGHDRVEWKGGVRGQGDGTWVVVNPGANGHACPLLHGWAAHDVAELLCGVVGIPEAAEEDETIAGVKEEDVLGVHHLGEGHELGVLDGRGRCPKVG